jgi:hypothetical protein
LMVAMPASTRVNSVRNDDSGLALGDDWPTSRSAHPGQTLSV